MINNYGILVVQPSKVVCANNFVHT